LHFHILFIADSAARSQTQRSSRMETELRGELLIMAKSGRLELGGNILRSLQVYFQPL